MPLYEYSCNKCQKTFEVVQKYSDALLKNCPDCGGAVSKLISRTTFQLKGTGWYATDYKASSASAPKAETSSVVKPTVSSTEGKSGKDGT